MLVILFCFVFATGFLLLFLLRLEWTLVLAFPMFQAFLLARVQSSPGPGDIWRIHQQTGSLSLSLLSQFTVTDCWTKTNKQECFRSITDFSEAPFDWEFINLTSNLKLSSISLKLQMFLFCMTVSHCCKLHLIRLLQQALNVLFLF